MLQLSDFTIEVLAGWWCEMNCFRWPNGIPSPKPDGWDELTNKQRHAHPEARKLFSELSAIVPQKERSRAWHKGGHCGEPKTDEQFEQWWKNTGHKYFA